jgi:hypothetical protein
MYLFRRNRPKLGVDHKFCINLCDLRVRLTTHYISMFYPCLLCHWYVLFSTWHQSLVVLERKIICVAFYSCSFKRFECLFFNVILVTIMAFTFNVWTIEKLNGNNLKDEDEIFLSQEIYAIISRKLLPLEI